MQTRWAKRTKAFNDTIFGEMNILARKHGAINLGQGAPDFSPPDFVQDAVKKAAAHPALQQYARGGGERVLVETIAHTMSERLGRDIDPEREVTITNGATEALFVAILSLVEPGDEVILLEPFYDSYPADVAIAGGSCIFVPLVPNHDGQWTLDQEELEKAFSNQTKLFILNTPHNPSGKVFDADELMMIARLCHKYDVMVLCDEVYEYLVFNGKHRSLAGMHDMWERSLTISSAGKTFSVTGWKVGWIVAPTELSLAARRIHQWVSFAVATPLQHAVATAMRWAIENNYYESLVDFYQKKEKRLFDALSETPFDVLRPEGTYFTMAALGKSSYKDDITCCRDLVERYGVAAIPPSVFYSEAHRHLGQRLLRFAFCKEDATLDEASKRLRDLR